MDMGDVRSPSLTALLGRRSESAEEVPRQQGRIARPPPKTIGHRFIMRKRLPGCRSVAEPAHGDGQRFVGRPSSNAALSPPRTYPGNRAA